MIVDDLRGAEALFHVTARFFVDRAEQRARTAAAWTAALLL
jgi:hypothetical protein